MKLWTMTRWSGLVCSKSVRGSFLKTWSANEDSDDMMSVIFRVEEEFDIPLWIERVPSQSNPSDVLSREVVSDFGSRSTSDPSSGHPRAQNGGESAAVGDEYHCKFTIFKRECACLQGFTVHGLLHTSYMAASVGPKAQ